MADYNYSPAFAYVGAGKQTVTATAVPPTKFFRFKSMQGNETQKVTPMRDGQSRDFVFAVKNGQWHERDFTTFLYPDETTFLLINTLGITDGESGAGDPYTHGGDSSNANNPLLTFEHSQGNGLDFMRTADCVIQELKMTQKAGEEADVYCKYAGRVTTPQAAATTVAYSVDRPATFADLTLTFNGVSVAGSDVTNFEIDAKLTQAQQPTMGSQAPQFIYGARDIAVAFDVLVPSKNLFRDIYFGGDSGTTVGNQPLITGTIIAKWDIPGSADHFVQVTLGAAVVAEGKDNADPAGKPYIVSCKGTVLLQGGTPAIAVSAQNAVSTAY